MFEILAQAEGAFGCFAIVAVCLVKSMTDFQKRLLTWIAIVFFAYGGIVTLIGLTRSVFGL